MEQKQQTSILVWIILVILLVLRIIFPILFTIISFGESSNWVIFTIQVGTYLLLVLLIIIERTRLDLYHIDKGSMVLLVLFSTWFRGMSFEAPITILIGIIFWSINILLVCFFIWRKVSLQETNMKWVLISIITSVLLAVPLAIMNSLQVSLFDNNKSLPPLSFFYYVQSIVRNVSQVAIFEEPVFRGILWGKLRERNVDERKILIIQAGLFWLAHIDRIFRPITLFITIPIMSIYLGIIAWKSRSIASPIIAHGLLNATGSILQYRFFNYA